MEEGNIKPIDRTSVHKICSGQVVLTLATAVKELVENSIDAGATVIEVKLEEHGSKVIEVSDNGKGVKSTDFQNLTLKHHTSKISDFSDLPFVSTFGFRGEALSSLCALSDLEVTTCHVDSEVGTNLKFDHNGNLTKSTPTARQTGTTVLLKNIFSTYPVRHKEFIRHIRREFAKMIQLLTAYCLISVDKRIMCTNISEKGRKTVVLSTHGLKSFKENIVSLFGDKQVKQIMEIKQKDLSEDILKEFFLTDSAIEKSKVFKLEGYISSSSHGEGRSSSDRQFYFIAGRPCDLPKVSKLINEVYHTFNKHQYPFVLLNISLTEGSADVNVTPDKRQIFIPDEKILLALIKATLLGMYGQQPSQIMMSSLNFVSSNQNPKQSGFSSSPTILENGHTSLSSLKRKFVIPTIDDDDEEEEETPIPSSFKSQKVCLSKNEDKKDTESLSSQSDPKDFPCSSNQSLLSTEIDSEKEMSPSQVSKSSTGNVSFTLTKPVNEEKFFKKCSPRKNGPERLRAILNAARKFPDKSENSNFKTSKTKKSSKFNIVNEKITNFCSKNDNSTTLTATNEEDDFDISTDADCLTDDNTDRSIVDLCELKSESEFTIDEPSLRKKKYRTLSFSMNLFSEEIKDECNEELFQEKCDYRKFRSKILPTDNHIAEEELKKQICKENFIDMEIIGQFNLGFIITRLHDDLFIIDQHATDEKYNFEQLQKNTILEMQHLFQPLPLNLTAVSEAILLDNITVFEMNGFKFQINEENVTGEKVQLVSVPVSQNWKFGKEDVDELIFMLTDNPVRMVRPSRVNQMFASRACRKSVMIGTALNTSMMKKLVTHMGEIEQPWNCPHGRPTMRHLFNLNLLNTV